MPLSQQPVNPHPSNQTALSEAEQAKQYASYAKGQEMKILSDEEDDFEGVFGRGVGVIDEEEKEYGDEDNVY